MSSLRSNPSHETAAPLWGRLLAAAAGLALAGFLAVSTGYAQPSGADEQRIVSLGGPVTEIVYALDAEERLVGVDASSVYPAAAQEDLPSVGYFRRVPAEGVLSLGPTLVLASEETGPPATLDQLRSAGVEVKTISGASSVDGAREKSAPWPRR